MGKFFKKKEVKEQLTPFKELSFSAKISYIWEYYKYYFLAVIIAVLVLISFVVAYKRNDFTTDCTIIVVDGKMTGYDDHSDAITVGFSNYLGIDGKKNRVICDYNYSLVPKMLDQEAYISEQKIYILSSTASMDGYLTTRKQIDYFSTDREIFLRDLREVLSDEELSKIGDSIIYYTKEDGTSIPFAVDLSNTKIKTQTDFTMEEPCYGIVVTAPNMDNAVAFIRYAFDL